MVLWLSFTLQYFTLVYVYSLIIIYCHIALSRLLLRDANLLWKSLFTILSLDIPFIVVYDVKKGKAVKKIATSESKIYNQYLYNSCYIIDLIKKNSIS